MADQLAAACLPAYGDAVVRAPHLTALAERSTVFESAYCPSPLCAPSRAGLLTGRLPSRTGVYDNAAEMRASLPTVTHRLRAAGYRTALAGKMHFVGPDQLHGFEERLTPDVYPAGFDWTPDWRLPPGERPPWYHTMESVLSPGRCVASMQQDYDDEVAFAGRRKLFDLAREGRERPFFLVVSFTHPHDPWELHPRWWDLYERSEIPAPVVPPIPLDEADPHSRRLRSMYGMTEPDAAQVLAARHAYLAAISYLDDRIGAVLGALREAGFEDDTAVAFCADHGEMLGERGLWFKMSFFEGSARVPLFVGVPGEPGGARVAEPVSLLDLGPTLLELAEAPGRPDGEGTTLLGSPGGDLRGAVPAEYLAEGVTAPAVMLRRGRHKFVACPGDPDQLYDLEEDPTELVNLAERPEHDPTVAVFREEVARRWDLESLERDVLASQEERRLVLSGLREGEPPRWDFEPSPQPRYVSAGVDLYHLQRRARLDAPEAPASD
jgi:choline-sulfatase